MGLRVSQSTQPQELEKVDNWYNLEGTQSEATSEAGDDKEFALMATEASDEITKDIDEDIMMGRCDHCGDYGQSGLRCQRCGEDTDMIYDAISQAEIKREREIERIYMYPEEIRERMKLERKTSSSILKEFLEEMRLKDVEQRYYRYVDDQIHLMHAVQQAGGRFGYSREWGKMLIEKLEDLEIHSCREFVTQAFKIGKVTEADQDVIQMILSESVRLMEENIWSAAVEVSAMREQKKLLGGSEEYALTMTENVTEKYLALWLADSGASTHMGPSDEIGRASCRERVLDGV